MSLSRSHNSSRADNNPAPEYVFVGAVTGAHGLKGEVRVYPHTDFPERFATTREIGIQRDAEPMRIYRIEHAKVANRRVVLRLEGITTIEQAELLRDAKLFAPATWLAELGPDEYYHYQLLGLEVVTTAGAALGPITDILATGANDVYETPLALIPATKDMIRDIDLEGRRMVVDDRPGLRKADPGT